MVNAVHQAVVDLIRDHRQVVFFRDLRRFQHVHPAGNRPGWIVWKAQQERLAPMGNGCPQVARDKIKIVFHVAGHFNRHAPRHDSSRLVSDETRRGDDHLVARVQQGNGG